MTGCGDRQGCMSAVKRRTNRVSPLAFTGGVEYAREEGECVEGVTPYCEGGVGRVRLAKLSGRNW